MWDLENVWGLFVFVFVLLLVECLHYTQVCEKQQQRSSFRAQDTEYWFHWNPGVIVQCTTGISAAPDASGAGGGEI